MPTLPFFLLSACLLGFLLPSYSLGADVQKPLIHAAGEATLAASGFTETEKSIMRDFFKRYADKDFTSTEDKGLYERFPPQDESDRESEIYGHKTYSPPSQKKKGKKGKKHMPPGLAKKDSLPPGLAKQLNKNGTLPPGIAKRSLPPELVDQLPRRMDAEEITVINDDIVLIEKVTGRIIDILYGGTRPK